MRKRIIYPCMLLMAMSCCILSCEKDPSISELKSDVTRISTEDSIKAAVAADSVANVARLDSVDVNFTLLNEEGKELSTFAYGENVSHWDRYLGMMTALSYPATVSPHDCHFFSHCSQSVSESSFFICSCNGFKSCWITSQTILLST